MNLQEAAAWIKDNLNQEIGANTLRKACASGRLRGTRKGEGTMHIRRTEWEVKEEDVTRFVREEYHPRLNRRTGKDNKQHIPLPNAPMNQDQENQGKNNIEENSEPKIFYRVIEYLFQRPLPIHGDRLEIYDTRVVEGKIRSKVKAEALVKLFEGQAEAANLADQLRYEVEKYSSSKKVK